MGTFVMSLGRIFLLLALLVEGGASSTRVRCFGSIVDGTLFCFLEYVSGFLGLDGFRASCL